MELRQPPRMVSNAHPDRQTRGLLWVILVLLVSLFGWVVVRGISQRRDAGRVERSRVVASKLLAAGALDEAATLYGEVLDQSYGLDKTAVGMAYSLGKTYLKAGQYEKALRWFYEAELMGPGDLADEVSSGIVNCLERLGRHHAAQAALERRVQLADAEVVRPESDTVVAKIGNMEIRLSEVERALDDLPPELAGVFAGAEGRRKFLEKYVADELLWRKASKLEYDRDPEVQRRYDQALRQLAVARFVDQELLRNLQVDETDLRNHYEANRERYEQVAEGGNQDQEITFETARPAVEAEYRMIKLRAIYDELIASELAAQEVEIYPEKMNEAR